MKKSCIAAASCLVLAVTFGAKADAAVKAAAPVKAATSVVARAGKVTVDAEELAAYVRWKQGTKGEELTFEQWRAFAVKLVVRKSLARDAEQRGLDREPEVERSLFQWKLRHYPEVFWANEVDAKVKVSDKELRAVIRPEEEFLLSAMLFGADDSGREKAAEVAALLQSGADFAATAKEHSEGLSAYKGGDMGWQTIPNPSIEEAQAAAIRLTKVGGYTEPLETQAGWAIFWVRRHRSADDIFKERREQAREKLLPDKIRLAHAAKLKELRDRANIGYPAEKPGAPKDAPLALVDGYAFTPAVFVGGGHGAGAIDPPKEQLRKVIDAFLVMREVERFGWDAEPELRRRRELERMEMLASVMIRREVEKKVKVTDADLREEYRRAGVPDWYELQVLIGSDLPTIEAGLARIRKGESFDKVVEQLDETRVGKRQGRLPLGPIVDYSPEVRAAVVALPDGGVSEVLPHGDGRWVVVKRLAKRTVTVPPFEVARVEILRKLATKSRAEQSEEFVERYREQIGIVLNEALLRKL